MLYLANINSARVSWGEKYNLHKEEWKSLFILYSLPHYWKNF